MMQGRVKKPSGVEEERASYSLWTAPPHCRESPFTSAVPVADLEAKVSQLRPRQAEEDEQTRAFRTPVTPEVLSQPTEN